MKTVRETLVETVKQGRKAERTGIEAAIDSLEKKVAMLASALRDLMDAEGGEAGENEDQKRAWARAEKALKLVGK